MSNVVTMPSTTITPEVSPYPLCQQLKACGTPCGSRALRKQRFCYFHKKMRKPSLLLTVSHLDSPHGIQLAVQNVLVNLLTGKIDHKTAGLAFYGLQIASSNFKQMQPPDSNQVAIDDTDEQLLEAKKANQQKPTIVRESKDTVMSTDSGDSAAAVDSIAAVESGSSVARASRPAQDETQTVEPSNIITMPDSDGDASLEAKDDIAPQLSDNTIRIAGPLVHRFNRGEKLSDKEFMQIISCIMKDGSGKEEAVRFAQAS